jgi:hypothetical protein
MLAPRVTPGRATSRARRCDRSCSSPPAPQQRAARRGPSQRGQQEAAAIHAGTIGRAPGVVNACAWCTLPACRGSRPRDRPPSPRSTPPSFCSVTTRHSLPVRSGDRQWPRSIKWITSVCSTSRGGPSALGGSVALHHYWMTLSARSNNDDGTVSPIALAVLRLTTSSKFDGCSMGKSPGLLPFRILST